MRVAGTKLFAGVAAVTMVTVGLLIVISAITSTEAASPQGPIDLLAADTDTTGNSANAIGSVEACAETSVGNQIVVDIIVQDVPAFVGPAPNQGGGVSGFDFFVHYDPAILNVTGSDISQMLAVEAGSGPLDFGDTPPDTGDGEFHVAAGDFGPSEMGDGVLARITFDAIGAGTSSIDIDPPDLNDSLPDIADGGNNLYDINTVLAGEVAVD
jgi:hypothetical protein